MIDIRVYSSGRTVLPVTFTSIQIISNGICMVTTSRLLVEYIHLLFRAGLIVTR
jgi:uncharacterized membrane protein YwaF